MSQPTTQLSWPVLIVEAFPNLTSIKTPEDVARWEQTICLHLKETPKPGETAEAVLWAAGHGEKDEFKYAPPSPQDVAFWIRRKRHEDSDRAYRADRERSYRKMTPDEQRKIAKVTTAFVIDMSMIGKPHMQEASKAGFRFLEAGEYLRETDEYWNDRAWLPMGKLMAAYSDGKPRRLVKYGNTCVRRKIESNPTNTNRLAAVEPQPAAAVPVLTPAVDSGKEPGRESAAVGAGREIGEGEEF